MFNKRLFEKLDYVLILIIMLLMVIGVVALSSAMSVFSTGDITGIQKQIAWIFVSVGVMLVIAVIDYETLGNFSFRWYLLIIILLSGVLYTPCINGAHSWFKFGFISFQPSEVAKIVLIISLARHIDKIVSKDEWGINNPKNILMLAIHSGLPILLILRQPDLGTAFVIVGIIIAMIFVSNIKFKYVGTVALLGILCLLALWYFVSVQKSDLFFKGYQADRIRVFFNPDIDPTGRGYNVLQSRMAIGSGEITGMGLFKGTQTQLGNIPAKTTDFVFAVIGEELGFVFCAIVVILFVLLMIRCVHIANMSKDFCGTLVAVGVMAMIGVHVFINIGMNMGLAPITGIPLPFISYGGSSLLTNMMGMGLVLSVAAKSKSR